MKTKNKIFCIGLNKTGTSSLHEAFKILGFRSVHYDCNEGKIKDIISDNHKNKNNLLSGIEHYNAYSDWNHPSINHLYKEFDKQYPNSKFILNTRNLEDWLISREKHVKKKPNLKELQKKYPSSAWFNIDKKAWKKEWIELHKEIKDYFKDRPNDFLIIDVPKGEGWEKLCPFLEVPFPDQPFPHCNKSNPKFYKLKKFLKKYAPKLYNKLKKFKKKIFNKNYK